jgi:hypothetical protein
MIFSELWTVATSNWFFHSKASSIS